MCDCKRVVHAYINERKQVNHYNCGIVQESELGPTDTG